jgi:hypothetical protein
MKKAPKPRAEKVKKQVFSPKNLYNGKYMVEVL